MNTATIASRLFTDIPLLRRRSNVCFPWREQKKYVHTATNRGKSIGEFWCKIMSHDTKFYSWIGEGVLNLCKLKSDAAHQGKKRNGVGYQESIWGIRFRSLWATVCRIMSYIRPRWASWMHFIIHVFFFFWKQVTLTTLCLFSHGTNDHLLFIF